MELYPITITPSTPPPTVTEYVGHDTVHFNPQTVATTHRELAYVDMLTTRRSHGLMTEWFFNDDQHSGPSFGVSLTGPDPEHNHSGQGGGTNIGDPFFDFNEHNHPRFSSFPLQTASSPDLSSLFSMLPFLRTLELSGGDHSPVSVGDSPLPHLLSEVNDDSSPIMSAFSPPLSPLAFAIPPGTHDPGNQNSLLFQEDDVLSDFITLSDRTIEVGSLFDRNSYSPFTGASAFTSSSSGSCYSNPSPFLLSSPQLPFHSSPDTDYGSSTSFLRAHGSEESGSNNSDQGTNGNPTFTGKEIGSEAGWLASEKRRTKIPKYCCTFCPRRLTSRDNWISHLDVHNNIKRYSCEYCPDRRFRTRAVLKRHQKSSRCGKRSTQ